MYEMYPLIYTQDSNHHLVLFPIHLGSAEYIFSFINLSSPIASFTSFSVMPFLKLGVLLFCAHILLIYYWLSYQTGVKYIGCSWPSLIYYCSLAHTVYPYLLWSSSSFPSSHLFIIQRIAIITENLKENIYILNLNIILILSETSNKLVTMSCFIDYIFIIWQLFVKID